MIMPPSYGITEEQYSSLTKPQPSKTTDGVWNVCLYSKRQCRYCQKSLPLAWLCYVENHASNAMNQLVTPHRYDRRNERNRVYFQLPDTESNQDFHSECEYIMNIERTHLDSEEGPNGVDEGEEYVYR